MTKYEPQAGVFVGRPPCVICGAAYRLHTDGACPERYRVATLEAAQRDLDAAIEANDSVGVFIARGDVQRLRGYR